ncbi:MAG TPA: GH25 family lysozyme [Mesorhizobium sp.]|uniref:glycoside hydrolase family 25 protein n=1 Tax=Mesorhizobium sp. TaxID=1871066 RepID=UPI002DDC96B4|nr:GH25 family lysozyme [Mesorhizobium sp.]HEV2506340.1 GH25 family lysozyme [Mesorhizobium sp.]
MRFTTVSAILLACAALASCASSSGMDEVLSPGPSSETTSSITRPNSPVPSASIKSDLREAPAPQMAMTMPVPEASIPEVESFAGSQPNMPSMPLPAMKPAILTPAEKPVIRKAAIVRGDVYARRFRDAKPINFGRTTSPRQLAVHGVDVSRWQGDIDWARLRSQGANFAYIKATDGGDHLDPMFKKNWREANEAGLRRGAYHFFYWCRTAGEQADWFIRNVPKVAGALPPVIDVEYNGESSCKRRLSREKVQEKMQVFMDKLERHYGQRPIIYTAPDFYRDNLRGAFLDYPFWLRAVAQHPSKVYPGRKWVFWQYSGSGLSHGVAGKIDLNAFHGSEDDWHDWVADKSM